MTASELFFFQANLSQPEHADDAQRGLRRYDRTLSGTIVSRWLAMPRSDQLSASTEKKEGMGGSVGDVALVHDLDAIGDPVARDQRVPHARRACGIDMYGHVYRHVCRHVYI